MKKKTIIIGAGFTGLATAYYLRKKFPQRKITIVEAGEKVGGLAAGFKLPRWRWSADYFYHHVFATDSDISHFLSELGLKNKLQFYSPLTSIWSHQRIIPFDSPSHLLKYPYLNLFQRLRLGIGLAALKLIPNGLSLEKYLLNQQLPSLIGQEGYNEIFYPLVKAKFGPYQDEVNLAWFWARIKARSKKLAYYQGGFQELAEDIKKKLIQEGVELIFNQPITKITLENNEYHLFSSQKKFSGETVILTTPPQKWWADSIPKSTYSRFWKGIKYLGAQTLFLRLKKPFLEKTYWLNINTKNYPFLVLCQHTNMVPNKYYNQEHLLYVGNYLPPEHPYWKRAKEELLDLFLPYLQKINPQFQKDWLIDFYKFEAQIAQPVVTKNYSHQLPPLQTNLPNLYIGNIFQIYPFDRGINYSIRLAKELSKIVL